MAAAAAAAAAAGFAKLHCRHPPTSYYSRDGLDRDFFIYF